MNLNLPFFLLDTSTTNSIIYQEEIKLTLSYKNKPNKSLPRWTSNSNRFAPCHHHTTESDKLGLVRRCHTTRRGHESCVPSKYPFNPCPGERERYLRPGPFGYLVGYKDREHVLPWRLNSSYRQALRLRYVRDKFVSKHWPDSWVLESS
jgi:hypothetical protein